MDSRVQGPAGAGHHGDPPGVFVAAWYRLSGIRLIDRITTFVFPTVMHPDPAYRLINNYDGYRNEWSDTWNEHEVWPVLRELDLVPLDFAEWRLGVWAVKRGGFYEDQGMCGISGYLGAGIRELDEPPAPLRSAIDYRGHD